MSVLEPYPNYRPAPADWLAPIPAHWQSRPLWSMFKRVKDIEHPDEPMLSVFRDYGVVPKVSRPNLNVTAENRNIYQLVHPGWLVTNRMKAWQGSVGVSTHRGIVSGHYICFAPSHQEHSAYLNYLCRSTAYIDGYQLISRGVRIGQAEIDNDLYRLLPLLVPPRSEQRVIAAYLDRETTQIGALIDKQEQLIETLGERRDASWARVYAEAVVGTEVVPLRRVVDSIVDGPFGSSLTSAHYEDTGARVIRLGNIGINEFRDSDKAYISPEYAAQLWAHSVEPGDVLVAGLGDERMPLGRATAVPPSLGPAIVKADCFRVRPALTVSAEYLAWALSAPQARAQIRLLARGATRQRLNTAVIREVTLPVPSRAVQDELVTRAGKRTAKVDALINKAEQFIDLAKERRAALITAAVTGQIDVRTASASTSVGEGV